MKLKDILIRINELRKIDQSRELTLEEQDELDNLCLDRDTCIELGQDEI